MVKKCSFCGKTQEQVGVLFDSGLKACICGDCVIALFRQLVFEDNQVLNLQKDGQVMETGRHA